MQVLEGGPYFFSQKFLVLKDWHRMVKPAEDQPSKILVEWLVQLGSHCMWTKPLQKLLGSRAFSTLNLQKTRVCIEISAEQDLPEEVIVIVEGESVVGPIEYQVLPPMCRHCKVFGHPNTQCSKKLPSTFNPLATYKTRVDSRDKGRAAEQVPTGGLATDKTLTKSAQKRIHTQIAKVMSPSCIYYNNPPPVAQGSGAKWSFLRGLASITSMYQVEKGCAKEMFVRTSPHDDLVEVLHWALVSTVETSSNVNNEANCSMAEATSTPSRKQVMRLNSINKTCRGL
ncbi:hypothetical protein RHMOL_Rhmol06G0119600 [Rhododendron molle]|uniref:Uncharacterized protein n=1 Tax=Rhododendron molle TaxID=49168 RepID=A0ACC0NBA1_RHOML|nr:hypothetical protein RHMOL_Rhmol06G0119600 [Rhododendron molle]